MTRGDQRDSQSAQARQPSGKGRNDGLTPEQRRERDANALHEKAARKAGQSGQSGGGADPKNKGDSQNGGGGSSK